MPRSPPTEEYSELLHTVLGSSPFSATVSDGQRWNVIEMDDIPPSDENGFRKVDGWSMSIDVAVGDRWVSNNGTVHGAAYAWILDDATSAALLAISTKTFWGFPMISGVSISMNIEYYNSCKIGDRLRVNVGIKKCSQRLAHLVCEIVDRDTGKKYASGSQWKAWKPVTDTRAKL